MKPNVVVLLVAAIVLWALGLMISTWPRGIAVLCWLGAFVSLGWSLYLHIRNHG